MNKSILAGAATVAAAILGAVVYVGMGMHTLDSAAYTPQAVPELPADRRLSQAEQLAKGVILKGEDVAVDSKGLVYSGSNADGRIYRLDPSTGRIGIFADTGALPIGMKFDGAGNLIVCVVPTGLVSIDPQGGKKVLTDSWNGEPFGFIDDVDVAADGRIYFSDATTKFTGRDGNPGFEHEILDSRPYGRLFVYDPASGTTRLLLKDLYFANGIAVAPDQSFVLVAETFRSRITRYWLRGDRAGSSEIFIDNLPGYPDGVLPASEGGFWVAMPFKRDSLAEAVQPWPFVKNLLAAVPKSLWARPNRYGLVMRMDEAKVLDSLQDPDGGIYSLTNAVEHGDHLYLGTLEGDSVSRVRLR